MNWKTYQSLTVKQKEEYNYRFKDNIQFNWSSFEILMWISIVVLIGIVMLFTSYVLITTSELEFAQDYVLKLLISANGLITAGVIIVAMIVLHNSFSRIFYVFQYGKWKKENKIKIKRWWHK